MKNRIGFAHVLIILIIGVIGYLLFHPKIWFPKKEKEAAEKIKSQGTKEWTNLKKIPAEVLARPPVYSHSIDCSPRQPKALSFFGDNIYVAYHRLNMVDILDYQGKRQGFFDPLAKDTLQVLSLTHDAEGSLYITDGKSKNILKFDKEQKFVSLFPNLPVTVDLEKRPQLPAGFFIWDNLGVVADLGSRSVKSFLLNGEFVVSIQGKHKKNVRSAWHPVNTAITDDGRILVSDIQNKTISAFTCAGQFAYDFEIHDEVKLEAPGSLDIDSLGRVYVIDGALNRLMVYDNFGRFLFSLRLHNKEAGRLSPVDGIAIDREQQRIFIADIKNQQIEVWKY